MILPNFFVAPLPSGVAPQDAFMNAALNVPPNVSPNMAITNWSSAPITDWPATPTSFQKREGLASLSKRCPLINDNVLLIALEEHNFFVDDAADLLLGVGIDDARSPILLEVFPQLPCHVI